jgi:hypothetical protein
MIFNPINSLLRITRCFSNIDQIKSKYFFVISSLASSSTINLNATMKKLISSRHYKQALDLFDQEYPRCTDATFTLALKACTKLGDHQRGVRIHQQLSSQLLRNPFIQASLIHFYSK